MLKSVVLFAAAMLPSIASAGEKSFMATGFDTLVAAGNHKVIVTAARGQSVRAVGDKDTLDRLEIEVEGRALKIRNKNSSGSWLSWRGDIKPATIYVSTPALKGVTLSGSGDVSIDRLRGDELAATLSGSGDLAIADATGRHLEATLSGSGDMAIAGACEASKLRVAGSGDIAAGKLKCRTVDASIAGSGDVSITASRSVVGRIAGSGSIDVYGPAKCEAKTVGSGRLRCGLKADGDS
jgi:hypothetical protein